MDKSVWREPIITPTKQTKSGKNSTNVFKITKNKHFLQCKTATLTAKHLHPQFSLSARPAPAIVFTFPPRWLTRRHNHPAYPYYCSSSVRCRGTFGFSHPVRGTVTSTNLWPLRRGRLGEGRRGGRGERHLWTEAGKTIDNRGQVSDYTCCFVAVCHGEGDSLEGG